MTRQLDAVVTISNDPSTLGDDADRADLERYARNLQEHLSERFESIVEVRLESTLQPACSDDADIERYVRELHQGDGWIEFAA